MMVACLKPVLSWGNFLLILGTINAGKPQD